MIAVSNAWKETNKQRILPESFLEISFAMTDAEAASHAVVFVAGENQSVFSNPANVVGSIHPEPPTYYATLEENLWLLDGTRNILPDTGPYNTPGLVGKYDMALEESLDVYLTFPEPRTEEIPGLTIIWSSEYGEYPTEYGVEIEDADGNVKGHVVKNNESNISILDIPISNYVSVEITAMSWVNRYRRPRIDRVIFGHAMTFGKNDILSYTHAQHGDLNTAELPQNSIEFSLDNSDGRWNPLNPVGIGRYLSERQEVIVRYGLTVNDKVEWINAGTFYLSEWSAPSNGFEARFAARDIFEFMLNEEYRLPGRNVTVNKTTTVHREPDPDSQLIYTWYSGYKTKVFEEQPGVDDYIWCRVNGGWVLLNDIDYDAPYGLGDFLTDAVHSVDLPHGFRTNIDSRMNDYTALVSPGRTVAEIVQLCANAGHCLIWHDRNGVLNIKPIDGTPGDYVISLDTSYSYPEIELSKPLRGVNVKYSYGYEENFAYSNYGEEVVLDNPLIIEPSIAAEWVRMVWEPRKSVCGEFRGDPRLDVFDVVKVESKYGVITPVILTDIKYTYNGSFRTTYSGRVVLDGVIV